MLRTHKKEGVWWVTHPDRRGEIHTYPTGFTDDVEFEKWKKDSKIGELANLAAADGVSAETVSRILGSNKRVSELFVEWKMWLANHSEKTTIRLYTDAVIAWALKENIMTKFPNQLIEADIYNFINGTGDTKASTRKVYLAAIRSFFKWMLGKGHVLVDPSSLVRVCYRDMTQEQKEPKKAIAFMQDDVDKLNTYIDKEIRNNLEMLKRGDIAESRSDKRTEMTYAKLDNLNFWKVAINLSWETALRLSDIAGLEWSSIKPTTIIVWTEKRDTRVELETSQRLRKLFLTIPFRDVIECFPEQKEWASAKRSTYFKRICKAAGVPSLSFHGLRHGAIQRWEAEGFCLAELAKRAGHTSTASTEGYL